MPRPGILTKDQVSDIIELYKSGVLLKDIRKKYGVSDSTIRHHIKRAGLKPGRKEYTSRGGVRVLNEKQNKCLKCGRMFTPYVIEYSINRHICYDCYLLNMDIDSRAENPIGRAI